MVAGGLQEKVKEDRQLSFYFYSCGTIPPPVIMVQVCKYEFFVLKFDGKNIHASFDWSRINPNQEMD